MYFSKFQLINILPSELTTVVQSQKYPIEIANNTVSCLALQSVTEWLTGTPYRLKGPVCLCLNRYIEI